MNQILTHLKFCCMIKFCINLFLVISLYSCVEDRLKTDSVKKVLNDELTPLALKNMGYEPALNELTKGQKEFAIKKSMFYPQWNVIEIESKQSKRNNRVYLMKESKGKEDVYNLWFFKKKTIDYDSYHIASFSKPGVPHIDSDTLKINFGNIINSYLYSEVENTYLLEESIKVVSVKEAGDYLKPTKNDNSEIFEETNYCNLSNGDFFTYLTKNDFNLEGNGSVRFEKTFDYGSNKWKEGAFTISGALDGVNHVLKGGYTITGSNTLYVENVRVVTGYFDGANNNGSNGIFTLTCEGTLKGSLSDGNNIRNYTVYRK